MTPKSWQDGETKRILFLRNKAEKLLKIKDRVPKTNRKQTENKATEVIENKRSVKKQTENKPKNKAGHVVENKGEAKMNRKRTRKRSNSPFHFPLAS